MNKNTALCKALKLKNDEFYTRYEDVKNVLAEYKDFFKGKTIYCNCDSIKSNFWIYLCEQFDNFGLKKLIATHYINSPFWKGEKPYKLELEAGNLKKSPLKGNGDFSSKECIEFLKESDIIITNPPFSLMREFIKLLVSYDKKFLITGALTYLNTRAGFEVLNKLFIGHCGSMTFETNSDKVLKLGTSCWYTNLKKTKNKKLILTKKYDPKVYKKFDHIDCINVDKISEIPCDYNGYMGVPVTIFSYDLDQFEIISLTMDDVPCNRPITDFPNGSLNKKRMFKRVIIRNKSPVLI